MFEPVDVNEPGPEDDIMWGSDWHGYKLWKLEQRSWIPSTGDPDLPEDDFPRYLVWPNHVGGHRGPETTTPMWFQPTGYVVPEGGNVAARNNRMNEMRANGITACYLGGLDPSNGEVVPEPANG